ncbi:PAS domain-containing protein [Tunicatimonas pelagia]|uniref:PAS domain-containing protein n=1 Tax=Tunicatimonas pelagia TaxID=931531 RepID=UPI0026670506|nr:PAS domain-containing protein [Tunicatimonas pelagia]WKN43900.1 PAS domain-containing protein [Tunicatimonas pelagia]
MPESYHLLLPNEKFSLQKFVLGGFGFGLLFPVGAIIADILLHSLPLTVASVVHVHQINPIHFVVDSAPFVLSATAYVIGRLIRSQEQTARKHLVGSEKKLYQVLRHNPDAIFLVRISDFQIEQYNSMALRLCGIDSKGDWDTYAPRFFASLNGSLSILTQLTSEGDTFSTEEVLTTAKGQIIWGQVSLYTFSMHEHTYQLIRIADITPMKQRELELETIKQELQQRGEELQLANEEITVINENLEQIVEERTNLLHQRNNQLAKYAFLNAHKIRGPLARVLGSSYALEYAKNEGERQKFIHSVAKSAQELDTVIHKMAETLTVTNDQQREEIINTIEEETTTSSEDSNRLYAK